MSETQSRRRTPGKPAANGRSTSKAKAAPPAIGPDSPEPRTNMRRALVEAQIYEQANRLFAEQGFAATTLQDIADAVGLTRPALYHYVSNKDELLAKLVAEITQDSAAGMAAISARGDLDPAGKVRAIVTANVRRQGEHSSQFRLLIRSETELPEPIASVHSSGRRAVLRSLTAVIREGLSDGSFRAVDARIAALGILGMMNWVAWWYTPSAATGLDQVCDELAELAVAGLTSGAEPGRADGPRAAIERLRGDLDRLERMLDT